jgi:polysaccharide export outer membrane protein
MNAAIQLIILNFKLLIPRPGLLAVLSALMALQSCLPYKKVPYFQDVAEVNDSTAIANYFSDPVIQRNDILKITVSSLDQEVTRLFSFNPDDNMNTNSYSTGSNYLVDPAGNIKLPLVGPVHVAGSTTWAIRDTITRLLQPYLRELVVEIRISSFRVSVVGDVESPGMYTIQNERITLPEALALAGDMNITAKRNNVLLIRDENGQRKYIRFDMQQKDLFNSPYYYLKSNDLVYVQPGKIATRDINFRNLTYLATIISLIALIVSISNQ